MQAPQPEVREDADRIILRNTVFSEDNYWDYWDSLLRKNARNDNNLVHTWQKAAERASRQRLRRFLLISVALLGLLGGIVGEQLGLWSLRAVVDRALEMVRQRVALFSEIAAAPEAGGGRVQGPQEAPLPDDSPHRALGTRGRMLERLCPHRRRSPRGLPLLLRCCRVVSCRRWRRCSLWMEQNSWPPKKWSLCVREIRCPKFSPKNMGNIPKLSSIWSARPIPAYAIFTS